MCNHHVLIDFFLPLIYCNSFGFICGFWSCLWVHYLLSVFCGWRLFLGHLLGFCGRGLLLFGTLDWLWAMGFSFCWWFHDLGMWFCVWICKRWKLFIPFFLIFFFFLLVWSPIWRLNMEFASVYSFVEIWLVNSFIENIVMAIQGCVLCSNIGFQHWRLLLAWDCFVSQLKLKLFGSQLRLI